MGSCSRCAALAPAYYSASGDALCRVCFYADQTRAQDARATESLAAQAPPGFKPAGTQAEGAASASRAGFLLLGCCVASALFTAVLLGRVYLASGALGLLALAGFARALALARQDGTGKAGIVAGVVASVFTLLFLVWVTILGAGA